MQQPGIIEKERGRRPFSVKGREALLEHLLNGRGRLAQLKAAGLPAVNLKSLKHTLAEVSGDFRKELTSLEIKFEKDLDKMLDKVTMMALEAAVPPTSQIM